MPSAKPRRAKPPPPPVTVGDLAAKLRQLAGEESDPRLKRWLLSLAAGHDVGGGKEPTWTGEER